MPLLHQTMTRPFRLNGLSVKHPRLPNSEVADVDHLLNFALALSDDFSRLDRDQLPEFVLEFAQRVTKLAHCFATHRSGRDTPFQKRFLSMRNRFVIIL